MDGAARLGLTCTRRAYPLAPEASSRPLGWRSRDYAETSVRESTSNMPRGSSPDSPGGQRSAAPAGQVRAGPRFRIFSLTISPPCETPRCSSPETPLPACAQPRRSRGAMALTVRRVDPRGAFPGPAIRAIRAGAFLLPSDARRQRHVASRLDVQLSAQSRSRPRAFIGSRASASRAGGLQRDRGRAGAEPPRRDRPGAVSARGVDAADRCRQMTLLRIARML